jgi:hypothetical protein
MILRALEFDWRSGGDIGVYSVLVRGYNNSCRRKNNVIKSNVISLIQMRDGMDMFNIEEY